MLISYRVGAGSKVMVEQEWMKVQVFRRESETLECPVSEASELEIL